MKFKYILNESDYTVQPKTKDELKRIIRNTIEEKGYNCDLNFIDVSKITDMSFLFSTSKFNGDISKWDVSKVKNMDSMFYNASSFNGDIDNWNVSKVENMKTMFKNSPLEDNEPDWYQE